MLIRPVIPAFQENVAAYLIALLANRLGYRFDLDRIWLRQDISVELKQQLRQWAEEVNRVLHGSAAGRMVSEWSKKAECYETVRNAEYTPAADAIPEIRQAENSIPV